MSKSLEITSSDGFYSSCKRSALETPYEKRVSGKRFADETTRVFRLGLACDVRKWRSDSVYPWVTRYFIPPPPFSVKLFMVEPRKQSDTWTLPVVYFKFLSGEGFCRYNSDTKTEFIVSVLIQRYNYVKMYLNITLSYSLNSTYYRAFHALGCRSRFFVNYNKCSY